MKESINFLLTNTIMTGRMKARAMKKKKEKRLQFSRICAKRSRIEVKYINK